ncbi:thiomuracin/GE37468 family thiazolyl RiPP peptide [Nonomuraea sp. NPDC046570]|uniref:thiomuracin/GE37468 family thiazolyl RiPP peptide n=1 Tax=Nonomuraea sp. NPDC046570 TaxID=3155255 RepID=UPI0033C0FA1A
MQKKISASLDLADVDIERIVVPSLGGTSLEALASGHGMDEMAASVLPSWCCSCPCCCC